ncbi:MULTISPECIES: fluoride efflux transporter FluC [Halorussus]|uniref:fluoride efflux transporter FluC n=1 Tax=Halorussus TaxID=1070314 RepID=UPI00209E3857|nr:CrcB family protein [Halorussus vallis]USZ74731.1 CrcB family protein [Halorussus vallis]
MNAFVLVGVGGVLGALSRYAVGLWLPGERWDTLVVNVLGSVALGVLTVGFADGAALLALFGTGFCGAFTTFSSFAVETVLLFEDGERRLAAGNAVVNLVGALVGVTVGGWAAALLG